MMKPDELHNFLIYNKNKELVYSKYNFNFELYKSVHNILTNDQTYTWKNFIIKNYIYLFLNVSPDDLLLKEFETKYINLVNKYNDEDEEYITMLINVYGLPYKIHNTLTRYFFKMTNEINIYLLKYGIIHTTSNYAIIKNQYNLEPHNYLDIGLIQDFMYIDNKNKKYTKYNFDYEKYSTYFQIYSNKLVLFTDFILRNSYLTSRTNSELHSNFKQFFKFDYDFVWFNNFIIDNCVSNLSYNNIDFESFQTLHNIKENVEITKEKYYTEYQFELKEIPFFTKKEIDVVNESVVSIYLENNNKQFTGILVNVPSLDNENEKYIITSYQFINGENVENFFAIIKNKNKSIVIEFTIIGYDKTTDIVVGHYNKMTHFNIFRKLNSDEFDSLELKLNNSLEKFQDVIIINNNFKNYKGVIIDTNYVEDYNVSSLENGLHPSTLIIETNLSNMYGCPVFIKNEELLSFVSMIIYDDKFVCACQPYILFNVVTHIISEFNLKTKTKNMNIIASLYPKSWLGIHCRNFTPSKDFNASPFIHFSYIGGILIEKFILGYNKRTHTLIYNVKDLKPDVTELKSILLNSKMYKLFNKYKYPIVLKSIAMFNDITSNYEKIYFGKYNNQKPYYYFTYGVLPKINQKMNMSYYYYNGANWIETDEIIGGEKDSFYVEYNYNGKLYIQHKLEYPNVLNEYICTKQVVNKIKLINDISLLLSETTLNNKDYCVTLNISKPTANKTSCLSGPYNNFYLPEYAYYNYQNKFDTFSEAIIAGYALTTKYCHGITYEPYCKKFTLRSSNNLKMSKRDEISFLILSNSEHNNVKEQELCVQQDMSMQKLLNNAIESSTKNSKLFNEKTQKRNKERNNIRELFENLHKKNENL
jgi:hypothetical protein